MSLTIGLTNGMGPQSRADALEVDASLLRVTLLAVATEHLAHLNGNTSDPAIVPKQSGMNLSLQRTGLAGTAIGALGARTDMGGAHATAVKALRRANPGLSTRQLYCSASTVGRDHPSATIHTLALAYTGASLPRHLIPPKLRRRLRRCRQHAGRPRATRRQARRGERAERSGSAHNRTGRDAGHAGPGRRDPRGLPPPSPLTMAGRATAYPGPRDPDRQGEPSRGRRLGVAALAAALLAAATAALLLRQGGGDPVVASASAGIRDNEAAQSFPEPASGRATSWPSTPAAAAAAAAANEDTGPSPWSSVGRPGAP